MDSEQQDLTTAEQTPVPTSPLMYVVIGLCFVVILALCVLTLARG